jgi:hypothetical protein
MFLVTDGTEESECRAVSVSSAVTDLRMMQIQTLESVYPLVNAYN